MLKNGGGESPRSKGARTGDATPSVGGGGNGSDGNTFPSATITIDKGDLCQILDTKFETAAKRSGNLIDTSIKGLREKMKVLIKSTTNNIPIQQTLFLLWNSR